MRAIVVLVILAFATGCAPQRRAAPMEDRRPPPQTQAPRVPAAVQPATPPPAPAPAPAAAPEGFYAIKRGDTLYSIALDHSHDHHNIAQWNSLDDPTKLSVEQLLRIKPPIQPAMIVNSDRPDSRIESRPLASVPDEQKPLAAEQRPTAPEPKPIASEEPKLEIHPLTFA